MSFIHPSKSSVAATPSVTNGETRSTFSLPQKIEEKVSKNLEKAKLVEDSRPVCRARRDLAPSCFSPAERKYGWGNYRPLANYTSNENDASSYSQSSREIEEDVCFPRVPMRVRVNDIDFDKIDEFISDTTKEYARVKTDRKEMAATSVFELSNVSSRHDGIVASRSSSERNPAHAFGSEGDDSSGDVQFAEENHLCKDIPNRFSIFSTGSQETVHAPDIPSLLGPDQTAKDLFNGGAPTWWLDCACPTDAEMRMLTTAFGIHPLTAEDIRMQEPREKVELFKNYYFVSFHTFENDRESEDFLDLIKVYVVVFREGILSFHFAPISHAANVRRRVRHLRNYVEVSADWICYALVDDITDSFAPAITSIEYEADAIEDSVFARELDFPSMLMRIGDARRRVMALMRLLMNKADVIKMFAKRCQEHDSNSPTRHLATAKPSDTHLGDFLTSNPAPLGNSDTASVHLSSPANSTRPSGDIALYLDDIQDHIVTMYQNLLAYEKIFSRSHSNYLAQLQAFSLNSNNRINEMLSKVTVLGTIFVPLNVVTGLFGMNVTVPGEAQGNVKWFFGILGIMVLFVIVVTLVSRWWLRQPLVYNQAGFGIVQGPLLPHSKKGTARSASKSVRSMPSKRYNYT
ncbi:hypothetical protein BABINDRAFT_159203 [Babjeviella inositovora NRRL Y-12698]|uniref:Uncharacterized protein n=1 Tax=Babjeviella inositovora NRRL Y-12698 TaxID=984486 RepID=A0A1E3R014_9ASCO|nr:uncharacterized protein BABINDRAFT_159203 [Babjeviella inositovora NRRL Y-12698]ODQ82672.1 hypothetical protein BABINDRAFT_159203 [Babjeviella inositovora NRRL Y-12698]